MNQTDTENISVSFRHQASMTRLSHNLLANLAGKGWSVILSIIVVPFYIKLLGIEAYGLIGFYLMLQGVCQILDFGLSPTLNREMARCSVLQNKAAEARDLVRTLEVGYWAIGAMIGLTLAAAAPVITDQWLNAGSLPPTEVERAVRLMGVLMALQWPLTLYSSGLMGLQKQVLLNSVSIPLSILSSGGAVLVLWVISPTITAFFAWQVFAGIVQLVVITGLLWRHLPTTGRRARFDSDLVRNIWHFAAGMGGISLSAIILTHLDKVILSKMLSLEMFGYYTLAGLLGRSLYILITPVFNVLFPRFSALAAENKVDRLKDLYHQGSQLMAMLVIPVAAVVALFSYDVLLLWTGDLDAARNAAPIASVLVIGTTLNGLMNLPYALQLAYGWTQIGLYINAVFIVVLVPAIVLATSQYGAVGAAAVWVVLNAMYMAVGVPLTHQRLLKGEAWDWFRTDISLPFLAALLVVGIGRWTIVGPMSRLAVLLSLGLVLVSSLLAAAWVAPRIRGWMVIHLMKVMPTRS
jgi:O-antigen/teichoic acid export membrane protein